MRASGWVAVLLLVGCGRDALVEPQTSEGPGQVLWRGSLTVTAERASRLGIAIPSSLEFTVVGGDADQEQQAFVSPRSLAGTTSLVRVAPRGAGHFELGRLALAQTSLTLEVGSASVTIGGEPVPVTGTVQTTAGDVIDQVSFVGTMRLSPSPGGAGVGLRSRRSSGAQRPFDALELRFEQPVSAAWLTGLTLIEDGAPLEFDLEASSQRYASRWGLRPRRWLTPGARLSLRGAVGGGVVVPEAPQVLVEKASPGWQTTSFEPRSPAVPSAWLEGAPTSPVTFVREGASVFRRVEVPGSAKTMRLWAFAATTERRERQSGVRVFERPGAGVVLLDAAPSPACALPRATLAPFTACTGWVPLTLDVSALGGRALYLEASSAAFTFFSPASSAVLVGEPVFEPAR
ncbi:MAG: hypothetical protein INH41_30140 [Myxococcaceae bacterium]|jgi:hypothetical protein|nr:hypothetical protein [Myxococcaceae bacterium]